LKVIGAGVGRTGTHSLKLALERLGFGPTHQWEDVVRAGPGCALRWHKAAAGEADWDALYAGYTSAVDWPTASFWRELAEAYPEARFVISNRSAESWYESFSETILRLMQNANHLPPQAQPFVTLGRAMLRKSGFDGLSGREELIAAYNAHMAAVTATLGSRVLVLDYRAGWAPLCDFLGCAVPDTPFPRSDSRQDFWDRIRNGPPPH